MLKNIEGQKVPQATFKIKKKGEWVEVTSDQLFNGKSVVVFSLPGAFTPTCSSTHVPGYNELSPDLHSCGVDDIVCVSVNDTFVMNEWQKTQNAARVTFIPDGNGEFTEKMGMLVDKSAIGFGKRSWRYSMHVKNGVIQKMFIEAEAPGDPFEVSDAETMLKYLNPKQGRPKRIAIFTKKGCPYCVKAKDMLAENDLNFEEIEIAGPISNIALFAVSGAKTVPQVFVDGQLIGGSEALEQYLESQKASLFS